MMTQGAIVLPVVALGMIDPSAIQRFSIPGPDLSGDWPLGSSIRGKEGAKGHGVGNLIAGDARRGDKTLIVDDVITTGGSTIDAVRRARDAVLQVTHAIVIVDRAEESGRQNIEHLGLTVASLFTLSDVLKEAQSQAPADTQPQQAGSVQVKSPG